ncbi:MAG: SDR family NAD(P)-dependent oxidoreductase [Pseudomonadota bacterium]
MDLRGKTAVVIGGGQTPGETIGNGRASAIAYAQAGARVIVADRDLASAEETRVLLEEANAKLEHHAIAVDVRQESEVIELINFSQTKAGGLDILHNNVGISLAGNDKPVEQIDADDFDQLVQINLRGMVFACKHVIPVMRRAKGGAIINISSLAAKKPYPGVGYKTTKAAVIALTEQLAAQNARYNIRVNAILPGLMNTPMAIESRVTTKTPREQVIAQRDKQVPLGAKMGTAWDVANAAVFLASEKAGYITGVSLPVDGGLNVI